MKKFARFVRKLFLTFYLIAVHLLAALFIFQQFVQPYFSAREAANVNVRDPTEQTDFPTPLPIPSIAKNTPLPETYINENSNDAAIPVSDNTLMIPVVGIKQEQLQDTYTVARSEGRVHNAIDIIAPPGTAVVAAADGEIDRFFDSERGGITIYQFSSDKHFVFYYAHLQKRAANLREHDTVKQGDIIGYVGDTGNAGAGNYHLHFEIMIPDDSNNSMKGTDINPYPLLKEGIQARH